MLTRFPTGGGSFDASALTKPVDAGRVQPYDNPMITPQNIVIGMGMFALIRSFINRTSPQNTPTTPPVLVEKSMPTYQLLRYEPAETRRVFVYLHGFYTTAEEEVINRDFRKVMKPGDVVVIPLLHRDTGTGGNNAHLLKDPMELDWLTHPGGQRVRYNRASLNIIAHSAGYAGTVSLLQTLQQTARQNAALYQVFPVDVYLLDATYGYINDFRAFVESGIARLHIYQSYRSQDTQRRGNALEPVAATYEVLREDHQGIVNAVLPTVFGGK